MVVAHRDGPNLSPPVLEATLAESNFSNAELYRLVVTLNGILSVMVKRLEEMAALKILSPEYIHEMKRMADTIDRDIGREYPPKT